MVPWVVAGLGVLCGAPPARGQEDSQNSALREEVEALKKRLAEIEGRLPAALEDEGAEPMVDRAEPEDAEVPGSELGDLEPAPGAGDAEGEGEDGGGSQLFGQILGDDDDGTGPTLTLSGFGHVSYEWSVLDSEVRGQDENTTASASGWVDITP